MSALSQLINQKYKWTLLLLDLVFLAVAAMAAYSLRLGIFSETVLFQPQFWLISVVILLSQYILGGYELESTTSKVSIGIRQIISLVIAVVSIILVNYLFSIDRAGLFGRGILLGTTLIFFFFAAVYRWILLSFLSSVRSRLKWLFIINEDLKKYFEGDCERLGFQGQIHYLNSSEFSKIKEQLNNKWSSIVVGLRPQEIEKDIADILLDAKFSGQKVIDLSRFYEQQWYKVPVYFLGPEWFLGSEGFESISHPISSKLKRIFDIVLSGLMFVFAFPFMILTAIAVKLESPGDALYKQIRTGKDGKTFFIFKFRSMRSDAEKNGAQWAQKNDNRITKVGKFIRLTRLDELPQLWNVLKGDMSFVGPRPERPEFNEQLAKEIPFYNLRHTMQPGLTGWAQVLYPYGASVDDSREKLQYELYYAKHYSLLMDFIIFFNTVRVVLFGRGR